MTTYIFLSGDTDHWQNEVSSDLMNVFSEAALIIYAPTISAAAIDHDWLEWINEAIERSDAALLVHENPTDGSLLAAEMAWLNKRGAFSVLVDLVDNPEFEIVRKCASVTTHDLKAGILILKAWMQDHVLAEETLQVES